MSKEIQPKIHKIICGSADKPVTIADIPIECYVLEDETRVFSQRSLHRSLGMSEGYRNGAPYLVGFVRPIAEKTPELRLLSSRLISPIEFHRSTGRTAFGYDATILADICEAILSARKADLLKTKYQLKIANRCEDLMRGFARVGIIALVDKATGYDKISTRKAYEDILRKYISPDLQDYPRTFPDDFYTEIFRLRDWNIVNIRRRPSYVAQITVDIVYDRLAPHVLENLRHLTERDNKGRLKTRLYRHLSPDVGHPKLIEHFVALNALMRASPNWRIFYSLLNRSLPRYNHTFPLLLNFPDDEKELVPERIASQNNYLK